MATQTEVGLKLFTPVLALLSIWLGLIRHEVQKYENPATEMPTEHKVVVVFGLLTLGDALREIIDAILTGVEGQYIHDALQSVEVLILGISVTVIIETLIRNRMGSTKEFTAEFVKVCLGGLVLYAVFTLSVQMFWG